MWQIISSLFGFGQSFQFTLTQFVCFWAIVHCCKWPNIENTIWSSGHTGQQDELYLKILGSYERRCKSEA